MIDSIRISVTQKCNLSCPYCHREGELSSEKELSLEEIERMMESAKKVNIKKVKITGGEPLLRNDIIEIVKIIKRYDFEDISLVTNGLLLEKYARQLKEAGLDRINIGCDSLNSNFLKNKNNILDGLKAAKEAGLHPIKINMVVLKGINDNEIGNMIQFARENNVILQLIELINTNDEFYKKYFYDLEKVEKNLERKAGRIIKREMQNRKQYDLGDILIEIVRPFHNKFCEHCKRLRITSDGKIKTCLFRNDNLVDFKDEYSLLKAIEIKEGLI